MSDEPKTFHVFQCQACPEQFETESKQQLAEHLETVHGVDVKNQPMTRRSTLHIDGKDSYENHWLLTFGDVEVLEVRGGERDADSMMRFAGDDE